MKCGNIRTRDINIEKSQPLCGFDPFVFGSVENISARSYLKHERTLFQRSPENDDDDDDGGGDGDGDVDDGDGHDDRIDSPNRITYRCERFL